MKTWNTPAIEELEINETMGGGHHFTFHDGFRSLDEHGYAQEGYQYISGIDSAL